MCFPICSAPSAFVCVSDEGPLSSPCRGFHTQPKATGSRVLLKGSHVPGCYIWPPAETNRRISFPLSGLKNCLKALHRRPPDLHDKSLPPLLLPGEKAASHPQSAPGAGGNWILVFLCPPSLPLLSVLVAGGVIISTLIRQRPRAPSAHHYSL